MTKEQIENRKKYYKSWRIKNRDRLLIAKREWSIKNHDYKKELDRLWRIKNSDRKKKRDAEYRKTNREKLRLQSKAWRKKNPKRSRELINRWTKENKDRVRSIKRKWSRNNPYQWRKDNAKRRLRKSGGSADGDDIAKISKWERGWRKKGNRVRCYWCRKYFGALLCHTDHIKPLARVGRHIIGNVCISCASCNSRKHKNSVDKWNSKLSEPVLLLD